jgi:NAD(P)-dependent dehydrogenase (short-subunit alcohol dehydrogenase family)
MMLTGARGLRVALAAEGCLLGRAVAAALDGLGARIELTSERQPELIEEAGLVSLADRLGCIDLFVNLVELPTSEPSLDDLSPAYLDRAAGAALVRPYRRIRAALPGLKARGGLIVSIPPAGKGLASTIVRHGTMGMTEMLSRELMSFGVRVNTLLPEPLAASRMATARRASEIAQALAYLASPLGAHINGQHLGLSRGVGQKR